MLLAAMAEEGVHAHECLMVGYDYVDREAAHTAQTNYVAQEHLLGRFDALTMTLTLTLTLILTLTLTLTLTLDSGDAERGGAARGRGSAAGAWRGLEP